MTANGEDCVVYQTYEIGGFSLYPISVTDYFAYLGIWFNYHGIVQKLIITMTVLRKIMDFPLSAIQRMAVLKQYVIPKLQYVGQIGLVCKTEIEK